jgi:hypothetical protein
MRAQKTPKSKMPVMGVQLFCPLSGFKKADGGVVPPHKMYLRICSNGSIMAYCGTHVFRCFCTDSETIQTMKAVADTAPKETP